MLSGAGVSDESHTPRKPDAGNEAGLYRQYSAHIVYMYSVKKYKSV